MNTNENRHTAQRRLILAVVKLAVQPLRAEDVLARARRRLRGVSTSTVYRNLDVLAARGEIFRLPAPDGVARYAGTLQPQAVFVCTRCGSEEVVSADAALRQFRRRLSQRVFQFTGYLQGWCVRCLKTRRV